MFLASSTFSVQLNEIVTKLVDSGIDLGQRLLAAIFIFVIGKLLINWANRIFAKILERHKVEVGVQTFLKSMVNILLVILLGLAIVGKLGIELTGFAALLASAGVAVGMALSGHLQNFAGGIIILVFRPYKVGDYIDSAAGASGTVKEIQIFHTVLVTGDNKVVYAPNGSMSNAVVTNYSHRDVRRIDFTYGFEYGEDYGRIEELLKQIVAADKRILENPAPFIRLGELAASSVNVTMRVWVKAPDYWDVYFQMNQTVYETFNKEGISFPYPQLTVHQA